MIKVTKFQTDMHNYVIRSADADSMIRKEILIGRRLADGLRSRIEDIYKLDPTVRELKRPL